MTITAIVLSIVFSLISILCFIGIDVAIEIHIIDNDMMVTSIAPQEILL